MVCNPPLKWAGGKRWQLPYLEPLFAKHTHRRLVEPFCGGLAVTLGLQPTHASLNDVNPHLINFYRWVQKGLTITIEMENDEAFFYANRTRFNEISHENSVEAASLFYYLNRTCYNGLCRFNRSGGFNVPFGRYNTINYTRDFSPYLPTLANWSFTLGDFSNVVLAPDDFVYADPPYDVEFTSYSAGGFSWDDQVRAAEWLAKHQGPVILVNQATPRITDLYHSLGFRLNYLDAPRRVSCTGDRTPAKEVLAYKSLDLTFNIG